MRYKEYDLRQEERSREFAKKADKFWGAFLMTENGKIKSTLLLYSLFWSFGYLAIYFAAFIFLLDPLHALTAGTPILVVNLVEALVPALAGTAVCGLTGKLFKERRMMLAAYLWLLVIALACFITMLVLLWGDGQALILFLQFFALAVPAPLLLGLGMSVWLYRRRGAAGSRKGV